MKDLQIHFGALVPSIAEQLAKAKLKASPKDVLHWQKDADAIVRLNVRGLLTDSATRAARKKLVKKMAKAVKE